MRPIQHDDCPDDLAAANRGCAALMGFLTILSFFFLCFLIAALAARYL